MMKYLVLVLFLLPIPASAQSVASLQAQIESLLRQLSGLETRLSEAEEHVTPMPQISVQAPQGATIAERHRFCRAYSRALRLGVSGDDVRALQEFLITEGLFSGEPTGFYGPITREAVQAWQAREHIVSSGSESATGWGAFGPKSRAHLMQWCAGAGSTAGAALRISPQSGIAPLTVTFYTHVSGFRPGIEKYVLDYGDGTIEHAAPCASPLDTCVAPGENRHAYTKGGVFRARLLRTTSPCPTDPQCLAESAVELSSIRIVVTDAAACTKELKPVCGLLPQRCPSGTSCAPAEATYSNRCLLDAAGAEFLYGSACRPAKANPADDPLCRSWFDGCNSCARMSPGTPGACTELACILGFTPGNQPKPYCKAYFDVATSSPSISRVTLGTMQATFDAGSIPVTWTTDVPQGEYGMYVVLEDASSRALAAKTVNPRSGATTFDVSSSASCNQYFSDALGPCTIKTGARYRIRAGLYTPPNACFGFCAPNTPMPSLSTFTFSNMFRISGGNQVSAPVTSCPQTAMQCPDGTYVSATGAACEYLCPGY